MTKNEYIVKLLDKLSDSWDFVKGFKVFLKNKDLDDKTLDILFELFSSNLNSFTKENEIKLMEKSLNIVSKLRKQEKQEIPKGLEKELDNLLSNL